jgi:hypothetical protein
LAWKVRRLLAQILKGGYAWAVAWRIGEGVSLLHEGKARLSILPDDGRRYYADPFPYCHRGQQFVFVEEYRFATRRGCISVAKVESDGALSIPRQIIEEPHHLSFPFVFEQDGEIWLIPESGDANRVDLYRAESFPFRWKREGVLLKDIAGYDATLFRQDEQLWIFLCLGRWRSSTWDNLCLFHAKNLMDMWKPCTANPVLLDARMSRPAGRLFRRNGETFRPAQDCSQMYGGAITICRLDVLSERAFRQTPTGRIRTDALGCHTYNCRSGVEVLDVFGAVRRSKDIGAFYTPSGDHEQRRASA